MRLCVRRWAAHHLTPWHACVRACMQHFAARMQTEADSPQSLGHELGRDASLHQTPSCRFVQVRTRIDRSGVVLRRPSSDGTHQGLTHGVHSACVCVCGRHMQLCILQQQHPPTTPCSKHALQAAGPWAALCRACSMHHARHATFNKCTTGCSPPIASASASAVCLEETELHNCTHLRQDRKCGFHTRMRILTAVPSHQALRCRRLLLLGYLNKAVAGGRLLGGGRCCSANRPRSWRRKQGICLSSSLTIHGVLSMRYVSTCSDHDARACAGSPWASGGPPTSLSKQRRKARWATNCSCESGCSTGEHHGDGE